MYAINLETCTALDIIKRSIVCHPSLFWENLHTRRVADLNYAASLPQSHGVVYRSVKASADATARACAFVKAENADAFTKDMAAGIIALNIACNLQCLPAHVRTSAAVRTWEPESV